MLPKLRGDLEYVQAFARAFEEGIKRETVLTAIADYERSLYTPNAPFDRYLRGDVSAIDPNQKRGYQLFKSYGCISCHQGINVGGNLFQKLGLFGDYFTADEVVSEANLGRYNITGNEDDRYVFKVPSLRNVAVTAPYFHDGGIDTLDEAVRIMGELQLGQTIHEADVRLIVSFLSSLTGEYRGRSLANMQTASR